MKPIGGSDSARRLSLGALVLATAAVSAAPAGAATVKHKKPAHRPVIQTGVVYTETNAVPINEVVVFNRGANGALVPRQRVPTGGVGAPSPACAMPTRACPIVDGQGEVNLAANGRILFAVNAGSNTISSFLESSLGLVLIDRQPSGGNFPVSLDSRGNVLYVVNQFTGNIAGFRFNNIGKMTPIPGSIRPLATPGPSGAAAQISFDRTGRTLAVSERGTNLIDTFPVVNGVAGTATGHPVPANAITPFGFAFDGLNRLVVSDALSQKTGAATTYSQALAAIDTQSTSGGAPCWVVVTPDNRYVYITNTTTKTIARFGLSADGHLSLLGLTQTLNTPPGPVLFPTDEALSSNGRYLYVLIPSVFGPDVSRIDEYRIGAGGTLTLLGSTPSNMGAGASGLAAR
jgi:6-phosphogluconolactonase (cycloisomerase 2 family)